MSIALRRTRVLPFRPFVRYAASIASKKGEPRSTTNTDNAEEQLAIMHKNLVLMQDHPNFDPWSQPIQALDVAIPYKLFPKSKPGTGITPYPSTWSARYNVFKQNFTNSIKNAMSMAHMSGYDSFPGHSIRYSSASRSVLGSVKDFFAYPVKIFQASSTKSNALISGVRRLCLESYAQAQIALARKDKEGLHEWTTEEYRIEMEKMLRRNGAGAGAGNTYIWNLHRETSPCKVVSIRAVEGHYGKIPPANGNRLTIQALVKFETEESLEIYSPSGKPLHTPASTQSSSSSPPAPLYTSSSSKTSSTHKNNTKRVPAPTTHITSYLLFEKRMFLNNGWVVRERIYPKAGAVGK